MELISIEILLLPLRATLGEGANCHAFPVAVQLHRWTTKVWAPLSHLSNFLSSPISSPKRKISSPSSTLWRLFENPRPWFYDLSGDSAIARSVNVARPLRNFTTRVHVSRCESASRRAYPFFAVFPLRLLLNISRLSFLVVDLRVSEMGNRETVDYDGVWELQLEFEEG